jgi:hypothetical protein
VIPQHFLREYRRVNILDGRFVAFSAPGFYFPGDLTKGDYVSPIETSAQGGERTVQRKVELVAHGFTGSKTKVTT